MPLLLSSAELYRARRTKGTARAQWHTERIHQLTCDTALVVDDILDTGGTLRLVQSELARSGPRSLKTAVLLRKPAKAGPDVAVDFIGFDIEDLFVVGYGLDYDGMYRNLPYVGVLKPELYAD